MPEEGGPDGWEREVACLAWEGDDALVLIDPLLPEDGTELQGLWNELDAIASGHKTPVSIVLSVWWHERSAGIVFERYSKVLGARLWAQERGVERIESPVTDSFAAGAALPGGIQAFDVHRETEVALWIPSARALAVADVLLGRESGLRLCPPSWVGGEESLAETSSSLERLLELPIEMVLVSHGPPVLSGGREALAAALR